MKRILVATDLSPGSDRALERALQLSRQLQVELRVLHVVQDQPSGHDARSSAEDSLNQRIRELGDDVDVSVRTAVGVPWTEILSEAVAWSAELIVLGAFGGTAGRFRGSTPERVIREGRHPVLVVRRPAEIAYRCAVVGVDFSLHSFWAARTAFTLAPEANFHLIHAYIPPRSIFLVRDIRADAREQRMHELDDVIDRELSAFLTRLGDRLPSHKRMVVEGQASDALLDRAGYLRADLVVAGTHGRTGVAHALLGSVAEELLNRAHCDVLVAKAW